MNKTFRKLIVSAIGGLGGANVAVAQSSVTLYGVVDTGIEYVSHAGANGTGSAYRVASGNSAGSRWGLRGKEGLGADLDAIFVLESGFNSDTGTSAQGGRPFGRQALVGISGTWGRLTLGRQQNSLFDLFLPFDPLRYASYSLLSQDAQFVGRADNTVKYTADIGNLTVTGMYSAGYDSTIANGGEVPGAPRVGQEIGAGASYTIGKLGMAAAYDQRRGTASDSVGNIERRYSAGLLYSLGRFEVIGGYRYLQGGLTASKMRSNLYWFGGSYALTPAFTVRAAVYRTDQRASANDATSFALQAMYRLSKRTDLYLDASYMKNSGNSNFGVGSFTTSAAGVGQTGVVAGVKHVF